MTTQMIRKQIYILERQNVLLKQLSQALGLSEAELIRQAIERELSGTPAQPIIPDRSAWQALDVFLEERQKKALKGTPYQWDRSEIYDDRENRRLHDRTQD